MHRKRKNDRFAKLHDGITRTMWAKEKRLNRMQRPKKLQKFDAREKKLEIKEMKRKRYFKRHPKY